MVKITLPLEGFQEIEQCNSVFYARIDQVIVDDMVECTELAVMVKGVPTYPKLVAALITERYDYDTQIAMLANHGDGDEDHEEAFNEFQGWREEAKRLARIIFPQE